MSARAHARALVVGGTDPLGGAGVFADAATLADLGVVPLAVVSAIVEQDSHGVHAVHPLDPDRVAAQVRRAVTDGRPSAVKLGALATAGIARAVLGVLDELAPRVPRVVDPVLAGGTADAPTMGSRALAAVYADVLGAHTLITPNAHELGAILGTAPPSTPEALDAAAVELHRRTGAAVLAKAGHVEPPGADRLVFGGRVRALVVHEGAWPDVHGTGCHLGSAICARVALGADVERAVEFGRRWLAEQMQLRVRQVGSGRPQIVHGTVP